MTITPPPGTTPLLYPTHAEIDLGAIHHNLRAVRDRVGAQRQVLVAVKADAYGHGAVTVARLVERTGSADWLGVATVPEGCALRDAGVTLPILKFSHALGDEVATAIAADVTLTVVDRTTAVHVAEAGRALGRRPEVHLKIDTGMRRIGVEPDQAVDAVADLDRSGRLRVTGVFTHLAAADHPSQDAFTAHQIAAFTHAARNLRQAVAHPMLMHCANSAGVLAHPDSWLDLVRPGIMVYGYYPDASTPPTVDLRPALTLRSKISFVKKIKKGDSVSYGRAWRAAQDTTIATVPVGYGDGYSRLLSNRGRMLVNGRSYPIAGRVCMDQTMIDVGPDGAVAVGDDVVLIGASGDELITCDEVADLMGSITYEVTSLLTPRVSRTYRGPISSS